MPLRAAALAVTLLLVGCGDPPMLGQDHRSRDRQALTAQVQQVADRVAPGTLGVAIEDLSTNRVIAFNGDRRFPLQGVAKAPLGAAVLAEVDAGRLRLDEVLPVKDVDLSPPHSPIADAWPDRRDYTVGELLERAVGDSDNTAADVLMKRIGGPGAVTAWLRDRKVYDLEIDRYARQLQPESLGLASFRADWKGEAAYRAALRTVPPETRRRAALAYLANQEDTATPLAAARFLEALNQDELLTPASTHRLMAIMTASRSGLGGLGAALPAGATLAHESGAAPTDLGFTAAANAIGIYTLKDGRRFAVTVFLSGSTLDAAARNRAIADVGRIAIQAAIRT